MEEKEEDSVADTLRDNIGRPAIVTYRELFESTYDLNPHQVETEELVTLASALLGQKAASSLDLDSLLNVLFATEIEPHLSNHIVIDFPTVQAALARIESDSSLIALRASMKIGPISWP